jgi:hypothetical protein
MREAVTSPTIALKHNVSVGKLRLSVDSSIVGQILAALERTGYGPATAPLLNAADDGWGEKTNAGR